MLLTRHYDQRPFNETVCDAIIANGGVKNPSKNVQNVCDDGCIKHGSDFSSVCDVGIRLSEINRLKWGATKETGSQVKACAIYGIQFTRMNCLWLSNTKETVSQIKVCVIEGIRFRRINYLRLGNRTEMGQPDQSVCDWWHTLYMDELFAISHNNWNS